MRVKITEIENESLKFVGSKIVPDFLLPRVGDKFYFKTIQQYSVIELHFNLMDQSLYDVEIFCEKTKSVS